VPPPPPDELPPEPSSVFGLAVFSAIARVSTSRQSEYSSSSVGMLLRASRIAEAE
jgi:hypothetical protein